jgi:hypothetical protein
MPNVVMLLLLRPCALLGRSSMVGLPGPAVLRRAGAAMLTPNWLHIMSSSVASSLALRGSTGPWGQ